MDRRLTYRVRCACGAVAQGERQAQPLTVACPGCKRCHFVFAGPVKPPPPVLPPLSWHYPLTALVLSFALLGLVAWIGLPLLTRGPVKPSPPSEHERHVKMQTALKLLQLGRFHSAVAEMDSLRELDAMPQAELAQIDQWRREADLLARLCPLPLEELVRQARFTNTPEEWAGHWQSFQGRTILIDDIVRRDDKGQPALTGLMVVVDGERVHLAIEELAVLQQLPLDRSPRLLFGVALKSCQREEGGRWVIRFKPTSCVLLTELSALESACAVPLDAEARTVLTQQAQWLAEFSPALPEPR